MTCGTMSVTGHCLTLRPKLPTLKNLAIVLYRDHGKYSYCFLTDNHEDLQQHQWS